MAVTHYTPMGLQVDRATAREMVAAIQYKPSAEETAAVLALEQARLEKKAAKKARKQFKIKDADAMSISSFSSTAALLKSRFHFGRSKNRQARINSLPAELESRRILRNQ